MTPFLRSFSEISKIKPGESARDFEKRQQQIVDKIIAGLKKTYNGRNDKEREIWEIKIDLKLAKNESDFERGDHGFFISDKVSSNRAGAAGYAPKGGMWSALDGKYVNSSHFSTDAAHEFGHNLGLDHPRSDDKKTVGSRITSSGSGWEDKNPLPHISEDNTMRYDGEQNEVDVNQIRWIRSNPGAYNHFGSEGLDKLK